MRKYMNQSYRSVGCCFFVSTTAVDLGVFEA